MNYARKEITHNESPERGLISGNIESSSNSTKSLLALLLIVLSDVMDKPDFKN